MRFVLLSVFIAFFTLACRTPASKESDQASSSSLFTEITDQAGLKFVHDAAVEGNYFFAEVQGSGGGFLDYDNDGDLDILLLNGSYRKKKVSNPPGTQLFRQEKNGAFVDVTEDSGLESVEYNSGLAVGDMDNDGLVDVYISSFGQDKLYRNLGNGKFQDVSRTAGIKDSTWGTSAVFFDFDRDGFLDLYVTTYVVYDPAAVCTDKVGRTDYCGPSAYKGQPDVLLRNNGNRTFTDVSLSSGIGQVTSKGLGVVSADFNDDGYADVYVANDGEPNHMWINRRNGTFQDVAMRLGTAVNAMGQAEAGMGIAFGDINGDADVDLFITHLRDESNTLYSNSGQLGFQDDTAASGLGPPSVPYTGWGVGFFDYDHDGDLDVAIANGRVTRGTPLVQKNPEEHWDPYKEPKMLFENNGSGQFQDACSKAPSFCTNIENGRMLAFGDIDNDGDVDLLLGNCGGPARLYRNDAPKNGHWIMIRAIDPALKRDAIGAKLTVHAGGRRFVRTIAPTYSYVASNDHRAHFGIGSATTVDKIEVVWPDGSHQVYPSMKADRLITLEKGK